MGAVFRFYEEFDVKESGVIQLVSCEVLRNLRGN
jgi:hypothetical protein